MGLYTVTRDKTGRVIRRRGTDPVTLRRTRAAAPQAADPAPVAPEGAPAARRPLAGLLGLLAGLKEVAA